MENSEPQQHDMSKKKKLSNLELQQSVQEIKDKLKKMGIERRHPGPRIEAPGHRRGGPSWS